MSTAGFYGNFDLVGELMMSSEGENILTCFGIFTKKLGKHISKISDNEVFILIDAIDSGLSIDNIYDLDKFFKYLIKDNKSRGKKVYIVISANNYTTTKLGKTFDVVNGVYKEIKDYNEFEKFILNTRKIKDKREERLRNKNRRT